MNIFYVTAASLLLFFNSLLAPHAQVKKVNYYHRTPRPSATASPTPVPTTTPSPTPTSTPTPTVTPSPSPSATVTPIPSPTPSPSPTPVSTAPTVSYIGMVLSRPGVYDYAPTVMNDNGVYKIWWCSPNNSGGVGDAIYYSTSSSPTSWSSFQRVLVTTPYSQENNNQSDGHVCDPSVVKVNGTYYLYYTAASFAGVNNQIFLATSTDGINFTKYPSNTNPTPIIADTAPDGQYGEGQSTLVYTSGVFYMYYTHAHTSGTVELEATSTDGINFTTIATAFNQNNFIPAFLDSYNKWFAVRAFDETHPTGIYYSFSADGALWSPNTLDSSDLLSIPANGSAHNAGLLTDPTGHISGNSTYVYYAAGGVTGTLSPNNWDIYGEQVTFH